MEKASYSSVCSYCCMTGYCDWKGSLEEWRERHVKECKFVLVGCPRCGDPMERGKQDEHDAVCREHPVQCELCGVVTVRRCLQDHLEIHCAKVVIECDGCKQEITRPDIHIHSEQCPEAIVLCEFVRYGCSARGIKRKDLQNHLDSDRDIHLRLLAVSHGRLKRKVSGLREELEEVKERIAPLEELLYSTFETECIESA